MKKNLILSVLVMTTIIVGMLGVVSAQEFINPDEDDHIKGDVLVEWENDGVPGLYLQYAEGTCADPEDWNDLAVAMPTSQETYLWDTTDVENGDVCLRLYESGEYDPIDLVIDNEDPEIISFVVTVHGDEKDEETEVFVYASDENLDSCEINWGDGSITDCSSNPEDTYPHPYEDNKDGGYDISLIVEDEAGNSVIDTITANVENVDPELSEEIDAPDNNDVDEDGLKEVAVGESVKFTATADDVDADLEAGLTCTWTFDGNDEVETTADEEGNCEVEYTWDSASTHTVDLTVEDKDGGEVDAVQFEVEVEEPEFMTPMQRVVIKNVFEFELDETWGVDGEPTQFQTSIEGLTDCELITPLGDMEVTNVEEEDRCEVDWTPEQDEKGEYKVIIKASNEEGDYKYYSFDVTVHSWGIHLDEGWNLISIPLIPTSSDIEDVFADIIENIAYEGTSTSTILQYDAVEEKWYKARRCSDPEDGICSTSNPELTDINPGYGYWIKMEKEDWIYGIEEDFNPSQQQLPVPSVELATESWNLVGRYSVIEELSIEDAFESLEDNYFEYGVWEFENPDSWNDVDELTLGKGYWMRTRIISGKETITYEPITYYL